MMRAMSLISDSIFTNIASNTEYWEDKSCSTLTVDVTNIPAPLRGSCIIPQVPRGVKKYEQRRKCRNVYFTSLMDHRCWINEEGTTCTCSLQHIRLCFFVHLILTLWHFFVLRLLYHFDCRVFTRISVHQSVMASMWVFNLKKLKFTPVSFSIFINIVL